MVERAIIESVQGYLRKLGEMGLEPDFAVLFGSYSSNTATEWSDIDLVVVSPVFDSTTSREPVNTLWRVAARTDSRIEPIPCGTIQWEEDDYTPILEIARREGVRIDR